MMPFTREIEVSEAPPPVPTEDERELLRLSGEPAILKLLDYTSWLERELLEKEEILDGLDTISRS